MLGAAVVGAPWLTPPGRNSTETLLKRIGPRDDAWHNALYKAHEQDIRRLAARKLPPGMRDLAADVTQMVLALAWRKRDDLPEEVGGWLYWATHYTCLSETRAARKHHTGRIDEDVAEFASPPDDEAIVARAQYEALVSKLKPIDRKLLELTEFEGMTNKEAGERLGLSEAAAAKRKSRALAQLRRHNPQPPHADQGDEA